MKIHLTVPACTMLFRFFYNVESFNKDANDTKKFEPYSCKPGDELGREEIAKIEKWMHKRIIRKNVNGEGLFTISEYKGEIQNNYVKRMKDIAKHYEGAGCLIVNCAAYTELIRCLDGRSEEENDLETSEPTLWVDSTRQQENAQATTPA